jgi:N-acetylglutamate synthase-like GNAT family acetyltransferase
MTGYEIRPALESESAQIKDLIHLVGINPTGLDWKRFVVAVNQTGQVVACGQIKPHGRDVRELASIAVHPDHRGCGLARMVIESLLLKAPRPLYLMCLSHNGAMYEKFGFRAIEANQTPRYFARMRQLFDVAETFRKSGRKLLVMKME